jgi:hypothetical protein
MSPYFAKLHRQLSVCVSLHNQDACINVLHANLADIHKEGASAKNDSEGKSDIPPARQDVSSSGKINCHSDV